MAPNLPWKAPPFGSPIWVEIPAVNVQGAYNFYKEVFNFPFYGEKQPKEYERDEVMLFEFTDPRISGGIKKIPADANSGQVRGGRGGMCVWWLVADVEKIVPIIEKAGGRSLTDVMKEGKNGLYRYFQDPEGNVSVAYQFVGVMAVEET